MGWMGWQRSCCLMCHPICHPIAKALLCYTHHHCQRLASCGPLCVPCGGAGLGPRGRNQYSLLLMMTVVLVHTRVVAVSVSELMLSEEEGDDHLVELFGLGRAFEAHLGEFDDLWIYQQTEAQWAGCPMRIQTAGWIPVCSKPKLSGSLWMKNWCSLHLSCRSLPRSC